MAAHTRSVRPIWRSTPLSSSGPRSDDKPPPAKSARMVQPGIEANRSCSGVESMVGKDLFVLTNVFLNNSHCTNHLQCSLPFLCKIQARAIASKPYKNEIVSLFSPYERSHFSEGKYFGLFFEVPTMPPYETRDLNIGKASEFLLVFIEAE